MINRKIWQAAWVIGSGLAIASIARASDVSQPMSDASQFTLAQSATTPPATTPPATAAPAEADQNGLLQSEMKERGYGGDMMDQYGLKLTGYAEAGWTFNFDRPHDGVNGPYDVFNDKSDDPTFDQFGLIFSRDAIVSGDRFDTGFKIHAIYGSDARFTQANGTNFYGSGSNNRQVELAGHKHLFVIVPGQNSPENQADVLQAYFTMNLPVGDGLLVTAGKFETPWGVERVEPTANMLYSHSYIFAISRPMTLTGIMGDYRIDDHWTAKGGVVVGWDQSLEDDNDYPSGFAQVGYKSDDDWDVTVTVMAGPEKPENRSDFRWLLDVTANYKIESDWTLSGEAVMGYENDVGTTITAAGDRAFLFTDAAWYGIAGYSTYRIDDEGMFALQTRLEYFNDNQGARQLITEVMSATVGLNIVPFVNDRIGKNLMIRPELKYTFALDHIFDDNTRLQETMFAIDAVFKF